MQHDRLALTGLAMHSRDLVNDSKADEIWSLNWAYLYDFLPRIDRLFEMHPIWMFSKTDRREFEKPRNHWKWLTEEKHDYPIYMLQDIPQVDRCAPYPIDEVTEFIFGSGLTRGKEPTDFYTSSFDYMMALAIYEHEINGWWNHVELYGFEMGASTEYRYQRDGAHFFIGVARGKGMVVDVPFNSVLIRAKRYGYEGGQMIYRQDLEMHLSNYEKQRRDAIARLQFAEGEYIQMKTNGASEEILKEQWEKVRSLRDKAAVIAGAWQAVDYLIKEVDLEEPELLLESPLQSIPVDL